MKSFNKVYGFNKTDNALSWVDIEVSSDNWNVFNIILDTINSWEIWKITTNEWKPIYKIVWELKEKWQNEHIQYSTFAQEVKLLSIYKITDPQIKEVCHYLQWVTDKKFKIAVATDSDKSSINNIYNEYIWIEVFDAGKWKKKVVFSKQSAQKIVEIVNNLKNHMKIFNKELIKKIH